MEFDIYQEISREFDSTNGDVMCAILGLPGEVGEVTELFKKDLYGGSMRQPLSKERVCEELGDVLWYIARIAGIQGIRLETIAHHNIAKLTDRRVRRDAEYLSR